MIYYFPMIFPASFTHVRSFVERPMISRPFFTSKVVFDPPLIPSASSPGHGPQCENWDDITALPEVLRADIEMEQTHGETHGENPDWKMICNFGVEIYLEVSWSS